ncbi:hypothetical protein LMG29739_03250 [Paraburkholderia solisilvae]|uniref:Uncharacterized protein n=1 Tax=Paraburkholderia solisilvae TaxID=624376 RepID=A0A6J5E0I4_9BURK|nr:hypothetical protein LMG29739_03250 [Paraburkholderia solisilvae]
MKLEPLSHCPDRTDAVVLQVRFDHRSRLPQPGAAARRAPAPAGPAPRLFGRLFVRMRIVKIAIGRLFRHHAADRACRCDVDARLLELETHKLSAQHLGNPHR